MARSVDPAIEVWFRGWCVRPRWRVLLGMLLLSALLGACVAPEIAVSADFDDHPDEVAAIKAAAAEWNRGTRNLAGISLRWHARGDMTGMRPLYRVAGVPSLQVGHTERHAALGVLFSEYIAIYPDAAALDQEREDELAKEEHRRPANIFYRTVLHEFGHNLGISKGYGYDNYGHSDVRGAVMFHSTDGVGDCVGPEDVRLFQDVNGDTGTLAPCGRQEPAGAE